MVFLFGKETLGIITRKMGKLKGIKHIKQGKVRPDFNVQKILIVNVDLKKKKKSILFSFAVGSVTVVSPLELIRTRMQYRNLSYNQLYMCISSKVATDGWFSLWRGWSSTVLRDVPFSGRAYFL